MKTKHFHAAFLLLFCTTSFWASNKQVDGIWYDFYNNYAVVTYRGANYSEYSNEYSGSVVIPSSVTYNGKIYNVTTIDYGAFNSCTNLTAVTISEGVTDIKNGAFADCTNLSSVTIPNSLTSIGGNVFLDCVSLTSPIYNSHLFVHLPVTYTGAFTLPDGIETIGMHAFHSCTGLTSVTIPNSVTSIGGGAFSGCSNLTSITIPNSVENIGEGAFSRCQMITSITIPSSVSTIGRQAFMYCSNLSSITIPRNVTNIEEDTFSHCSSLSSVTIPNGVISIGYCAFYYCTQLMSISIPNSVQSIGRDAFTNCNILTSVTCEPTTPAVLGTDVFLRTSAYLKIYVPCGSIDSYKNAAGWSDYAPHIQYKPTNFNVVSEDNDKGNVAYPQNITICEENVEISATPHYGYHFSKWSDGNINNPRIIDPTIDNTYTATFAKNKYNITKIADNTQGSISGLSQAEYLNQVILTAEPKYGYHFAQWSDGITDNPRIFELTCDTTFTAEFARNSYSITTASSNPEWGTTAGDSIVLYQEQVKISATANYGYHFVSWNDNNTINPRTILVTKDETYTASFAKNTYAITKIANNGSISGKNQAAYLDQVTLTPVPNYGYHFVQWSDGNTDDPRTIELTQDTTFTAEFAKNSYSITTASSNSEWGTTEGDATVLYQEQVEISATANYGYHFDHWNDNKTTTVH